MSPIDSAEVHKFVARNRQGRVSAGHSCLASHSSSGCLIPAMRPSRQMCAISVLCGSMEVDDQVCNRGPRPSHVYAYAVDIARALDQGDSCIPFSRLTRRKQTASRAPLTKIYLISDLNGKIWIFTSIQPSIRVVCILRANCEQEIWTR